MTHAIVPAAWEAEVGGSLEPRSLRSAWPTWSNPVSTENTKINQAWWCMPVIPATGEAEAGESLEPWRQRLQWAKIALLNSNLGDRVRLCLKKQQQTNDFSPISTTTASCYTPLIVGRRSGKARVVSCSQAVISPCHLTNMGWYDDRTCLHTIARVSLAVQLSCCPNSARGTFSWSKSENLYIETDSSSWPLPSKRGILSSKICLVSVTTGKYLFSQREIIRINFRF